MPIQKTIATNYGVDITYSKVAGLTTDSANNQINIIVSGYVNSGAPQPIVQTIYRVVDHTVPQEITNKVTDPETGEISDQLVVSDLEVHDFTNMVAALASQDYKTVAETYLLTLPDFAGGTVVA